jgi:hypothetical protein
VVVRTTTVSWRESACNSWAASEGINVMFNFRCG